MLDEGSIMEKLKYPTRYRCTTSFLLHRKTLTSAEDSLHSSHVIIYWEVSQAGMNYSIATFDGEN
ncbi:hypothetical protein C1X30_09350 [Pseudomonas sp. FW305-BF6]|nr:hypothetical protein C1X28_07720 [Pseudomonas sp. FW305-BF15]PNB81000.1 hypothetical protein C1X30_09350 [Pseudomonas sp. FW305-BF6]